MSASPIALPPTVTPIIELRELGITNPPRGVSRRSEHAQVLLDSYASALATQRAGPPADDGPGGAHNNTAILRAGNVDPTSSTARTIRNLRLDTIPVEIVNESYRHLDSDGEARLAGEVSTCSRSPTCSIDHRIWNLDHMNSVGQCTTP